MCWRAVTYNVVVHQADMIGHRPVSFVTLTAPATDGLKTMEKTVCPEPKKEPLK